MEFLLIIFVCMAVIIFSGVASFAFMYGLVVLIMKYIEKKIDKEDDNV